MSLCFPKGSPPVRPALAVLGKGSARMSLKITVGDSSAALRPARPVPKAGLLYLGVPASNVPGLPPGLGGLACSDV